MAGFKISIITFGTGMTDTSLWWSWPVIITSS